ncbi:MAG TPA: serine protease [Candidatus Dormibacteraeota bacterium]|jgi:S1-C subfamily serine protease|nr:serine protease [Candidatus Dormibacteraeota bacterium]
MDKIVVTPQELATAVPRPIDEPARLAPAKLPPVISWWARLAFAPLVFILPLLSLVTIILRVSIRNQPPRVKHSWTAFTSTLLIISGFLTSAAAVLSVSFVPLPAVVSRGLSDLDERAIFPDLPSATTMSGSVVSAHLKPLVAVITTARRLWFSQQEAPSGGLGAGILLRANAGGYLFATARHVVDGENWRYSRNARALVAMASGSWAGADVIARHASLDLLLLWIPRESGHGDFVEPVASGIEGENIFVIGHPEGLKFTLSTGIVSRLDQDILQVSAPISPGNSGGPVFDDKGNLVGIVVSKINKTTDPNAENLNFAIRADNLLHDSGWEFTNGGRERFQEFLSSQTRRHISAKEPAGTGSAARSE